MLYEHKMYEAKKLIATFYSDIIYNNTFLDCNGISY